MRPVLRGTDPGGYAKYGFAYPALAGRIGRYCSFCEASLKNGHVEHVLPKVLYPAEALSWGNFLLACANCNATKGAWPTPAAAGRLATFWPDEANTARAYDYPEHLPPRAASALSAADRPLAEQLLVRVGLDRSPLHTGWSEKDDRWELRNEVWDQALECREDVAIQDTDIHRKRIAQLAAARGFWSVWRAVFAADDDMLRRLNAAFLGTAPDCFDGNGHALPRPAGRL